MWSVVSFFLAIQPAIIKMRRTISFFLCCWLIVLILVSRVLKSGVSFCANIVYNIISMTYIVNEVK